MKRTFSQELASPEEQKFNTAMSNLRTLVEDGSRYLKQMFCIQDFVSNLKVSQLRMVY